MSFILYLFGFTNMYVMYTTADNTTINGTAITDPVIASGLSIFQYIMDEMWIFVGGIAIALAGLGLAEALGAFKGATATVLTYVIPLILLLVLNIFVFPIGSISSSLGFADAVFGAGVITGVIILIFNACYIMAVIEFVRGGSI